MTVIEKTTESCFRQTMLWFWWLSSVDIWYKWLVWFARSGLQKLIESFFSRSRTLISTTSTWIRFGTTVWTSMICTMCRSMWGKKFQKKMNLSKNRERKMIWLRKRFHFSDDNISWNILELTNIAFSFFFVNLTKNRPHFESLYFVSVVVKVFYYFVHSLKFSLQFSQPSLFTLNFLLFPFDSTFLESDSLHKLIMLFFLLF